MKSTITPQPQSLSLEDQLVGIEAKTAPYPAARSWSGGRRRIVGKGPLESYCYHAMSRTCGGEVHFDEVEKEALRRLLWKMSEFCGVKVVTYCVMSNHFHVLVEVPWREVWLRRFEGPEGEQKKRCQASSACQATHSCFLPPHEIHDFPSVTVVFARRPACRH